MLSLSIIVPVLNEETTLCHALDAIKPVLSSINDVELIVVDGGSHDDTLTVAMNYTSHCLSSTKGRASQMNLGAKHASNDILVFLHADTILPNDFQLLISNALSIKNKQWGRFNVKLSGPHIMLRIIETLMNFRSCITSIATGDQVIFVRKSTFEMVSGYSSIPLMEDIELSKKLKNHSRAICIKNPVTTSSRRWEINGFFKTIMLMWKLRFLYFMGVPAKKLISSYYK